LVTHTKQIGNNKAEKGSPNHLLTYRYPSNKGNEMEAVMNAFGDQMSFQDKLALEDSKSIKTKMQGTCTAEIYKKTFLQQNKSWTKDFTQWKLKTSQVVSPET